MNKIFNESGGSFFKLTILSEKVRLNFLRFDVFYKFVGEAKKQAGIWQRSLHLNIILVQLEENSFQILFELFFLADVDLFVSGFSQNFKFSLLYLPYQVWYHSRDIGKL